MQTIEDTSLLAVAAFNLELGASTRANSQPVAPFAKPFDTGCSATPMQQIKQKINGIQRLPSRNKGVQIKKRRVAERRKRMKDFVFS